MGGPEIKTPPFPFVYGGEPEVLCRDCQLPCRLQQTAVDCLRRFFLQGLLQCSYFVEGYCFLIEQPGCVFDNGGIHDSYWMNLLNDYYHNVGNRSETEPDFARRSKELKRLVAEQIENRMVSLCRYLEEYYNRIMETGGGLSEEAMGKLDEAYLYLLAGTGRKA